MRSSAMTNDPHTHRESMTDAEYQDFLESSDVGRGPIQNSRVWLVPMMLVGLALLCAGFAGLMGWL